jgi:hypothetical protein
MIYKIKLTRLSLDMAFYVKVMEASACSRMHGVPSLVRL